MPWLARDSEGRRLRRRSSSLHSFAAIRNNQLRNYTFEARKRAVRRQECLLRGVLGSTAVSYQARAKVEDGTLIPLNQTVECVKAAVL